MTFFRILYTELQILKTFINSTFSKPEDDNLYYCSDFRYESNGIFVLGVGFFFLQTNFDFLTSLFWRIFLISFESHCCPELKFEKIFYLWSFLVK